MDKLEEWEVLEFYDIIDYSEYASWEQTRLLMSMNVDHKKVKKLSDIIKFPWDEDYKKDDIEISADDIKRLKQMSEVYSKKLNKK